MPVVSVSRLAWIIVSAVLSRMTLNTARRFLYPFAPVFSRALGVPLTAITSLIAVNQATGLFSAFFAPIGDLVGYRIMMIVGLALLAIGLFTGGCLPLYSVILFAFFLAGVGKSVFDPALQAYVGGQVPFERRGLAVGVIEMSWAGSSLLGIPLAGFLIDRFGWRSPFFVLSAVALIGIVALKLLIPDEETRLSGIRQAFGNLGGSWRKLGQERIAVGALGYAFFLNAANDNLFVVYGAWLEHSFGLSIVALGLSTGVIGIAELIGEGLTACLADRLGLKWSMLVGVILSGVSYLILPVLGRSLMTVLVMLFVVFVTFEFTVVTSLSFFTEILPDARATMMAGFFAAAGLGRICGTLIGGRLWMTKHIFIIGLASTLMSGLAFIGLIWGLHGWQQKVAV
jgi:predicted MFS family arabinose efflux permease